MPKLPCSLASIYSKSWVMKETLTVQCQFVGCFQEPSLLDGQHQVLVCSCKTVSCKSLSLWILWVCPENLDGEDYIPKYASFWFPIFLVIFLGAHLCITDHNLVLSLLCHYHWVSSASISWMFSLSSCSEFWHDNPALDIISFLGGLSVHSWV